MYDLLLMATAQAGMYDLFFLPVINGHSSTAGMYDIVPHNVRMS